VTDETVVGTISHMTHAIKWILGIAGAVVTLGIITMVSVLWTMNTTLTRIETNQIHMVKQSEETPSRGEMTGQMNIVHERIGTNSRDIEDLRQRLHDVEVSSNGR
jgi:hypothetical protein